MSHSDTPILRHSDTSLRATSESLATLRDEWAALAPTPFHRPEWHEAWLRHFRPAGDVVFVGVRPGGDGPLAGVAAFDLTPHGARELGDHNVRDYAGPVAAPGRESEVADVLLEWLAEDFSERATFWGLAADDPMRAAFAEAAGVHGWRCVEEPEAVCPRVTLRETFDAYVASLGKHDRHELRRKLRHLDAAGDVAYRSEADPRRIAEAMDSLFLQMRRSRAAKQAFLSPAMEAFFRDLASTFGEAGMARLDSLELDGRPAATLLLFEDRGTSYLYNSGFDPEFQSLAVGLLSKALAIRDRIERGASMFDFLRGDEEYKRRLGGEPCPVFTLLLERG